MSAVPSSPRRPASARASAARPWTPAASSDASDCTATSNALRPTRPSTARTASKAVALYRNESQRCLSATTRRLNERLTTSSGAIATEKDTQRPATAPQASPSSTAVANAPPESIFLTAMARLRNVASAELITLPRGATSHRTAPQPPASAPLSRGSPRNVPSSVGTAAPATAAAVDYRSVAGGAFMRTATQCDAALKALRDLQRAMSDPVAAAAARVAALSALAGPEVSSSDQQQPLASPATRAGAAPPHATSAQAQPTVVDQHCATDEQLAPVQPLDADEEALAAELECDEELGYGRFFVSGALVIRRVEAKLAHYRAHPSEVALLDARVTRHRAKQRAERHAEFLAALAKQREKRIGRVGNDFDKTTSGFSSLPAGGGRAAASGSDDDLSGNDGSEGGHGGGAGRVPLYQLHLERQRVYGTVGYRQVRTADQLVSHNNQRFLEHRRQYVSALRDQRDRTETAIRRHDEIVAQADQQRQRAAMAAVISDWIVIVKLHQSARWLRRTAAMVDATRRGLDRYRVWARYFDAWHARTVHRMQEEHRGRLRGKLRFALCAARLMAFCLVRRRCVRTIALFVDHMRSAGRFAVALNRFRRKIALCQRTVRAFLFHRRRRLQLLLMQWDRVEDPLRRAAHEQFRQDAARRRREQEQKRAFMSSKVIKAEREKAQRARAKMTREQLIAAKVKETLEGDTFDYSRPVPFRLRVEALSKMWTERRLKFFRYEAPAQFAADSAAYNKKLEAFELAILAGRTNVRKPAPPRRREFPLFFPVHVMERVVRGAMDSLREIDMDIKQTAATQAASIPELEHKYTALRDNLYVQRFGIHNDAHMRLVTADWRR